MHNFGSKCSYEFKVKTIIANLKAKMTERKPSKIDNGYFTWTIICHILPFNQWINDIQLVYGISCSQLFEQDSSGSCQVIKS